MRKLQESRDGEKRKTLLSSFGVTESELSKDSIDRTLEAISSKLEKTNSYDEREKLHESLRSLFYMTESSESKDEIRELFRAYPSPTQVIQPQRKPASSK
jgi:hypothetical protein